MATSRSGSNPGSTAWSLTNELSRSAPAASNGSASANCATTNALRTPCVPRPAPTLRVPPWRAPRCPPSSIATGDALMMIAATSAVPRATATPLTPTVA